MAVNKRNDSLLTLFKSEIIEQIRKKKVLKNTFVKYGLRKNFSGVDLEENEKLKNDLQKFRKNKGDGKNSVSHRRTSLAHMFGGWKQ